MKVYVKKGEDSIIPGLIITIVFSLVGGWLVTAFIMEGISNSWIEALKMQGANMPFAVMFLGFGIYFIIYLLKFPRAYKAKIISKQVQNYNGKDIICMKVQTFVKDKNGDEIESDIYECYTKRENNFSVGNECIACVKEFNWRIRSIEEVGTINKVAEKDVRENGMAIVYGAIWFVLAGLMILSILGMILYPKYIVTYVIAIAFFSVPVSALTVLLAKELKKE